MNIDKKSLSLFILAVIILFGAYLRLDQFLLQTLIDDEWHAVHKLLNSTPEKFMHSFGHADYSIPLTLLYWFEANLFGLSELSMRWPMMVFGLATLILFPLYINKKFGSNTAIIFAILLAISPLLIQYSRLARPYAITLFLVYFSIWLFYRYHKNYPEKGHPPFSYIIYYALTTALAIWMHLIVAFFIVAPFVLEFTSVVIFNKQKITQMTLKLLYLGVPAFILILVLIFTPLSNSMTALTSKGANDIPHLDTYFGFIYLLFGSRSSLVVVTLSLLAVIGLPKILKKSKMARSIFLGTFLTLLIVYVLQPAWVYVPITFTRYVLPIIPVVLVSTTLGLIRMCQFVQTSIPNKIIQTTFITGLLFTLIVGLVISSPLHETIRKPNSNTLHSTYLIDLRAGKNIIDKIIHKRPVSEFWQSLSKNPLHYKIAVAPWFFQSFYWDAPIWEETSRQYIVPAYLIGLCVEDRKGEVPNNGQFKFKNVAYLAHSQDLVKREIDYIVWQKSARLDFEIKNLDMQKCETIIKQKYGKPYYEDSIIAVFKTASEDNRIDK